MSPCEKLIDLPHPEWGGIVSGGIAAGATAGIEAGQVVFLPGLACARQPQEGVLFTPAILGSAKNASFDPATGRLGGISASGEDAEVLRALMRRFSDARAALVNTLVPGSR